MDNDQGVGRLSPAHVINNVAADCGCQVAVASAVDVGHHSTVFDHIHAVVGEAQHVAVGHRELERHQPHAVASAWCAAVWQLEDVLCAGSTAKATLRLNEHVGGLGQRIVVGGQVNPRTKQRVKLASRKVGGELYKAWHQFLTAIRL